MKFIKIYSAYAEIDTTEGRGGRRLLGHFKNKEDAEFVAKGKGVWDGPGPISEKTFVTTDEINGFLTVASKSRKIY